MNAISKSRYEAHELKEREANYMLIKKILIISAINVQLSSTYSIMNC